MKYVGLQQQIKSNNRKSIMLLLAFPLLVLTMVYAVVYFVNLDPDFPTPISYVNQQFIQSVPAVLIVVGIWFLIAYFFNVSMINAAAGSETLSRKDNKRVYNLTENLCMSVGMKMPKLRVIHSDALNAFASGINEKSYTVTLTTGIMEALDDEELEGVIAHELTHIRNHDVKLLIVSVIFVGIFSFIMQVALRMFIYGGGRRSSNNNNDKGGGAALILIVLVMSAVAYFLSFLFKMALSRKREYMADSGAVELTRNAPALERALRKISGNSEVEEVTNQEVKQMFFDNTSKDKTANFIGFTSLFSTHPPIEKRIQFLQQL